MNVLGFIGGFHDPAACLLVDGKIVAVAEEERFSRVKHAYGSFPDRAAEYCLKEAGLIWREIDRVAYPFDLDKLISTNLHIEPWKNDLREDRLRLASFKSYYGGVTLRAKSWCAERGLPAPDMVDHHTAHLACAMFGSEFDEAALLSIDSRGETHSTVIARGEGASIKELGRAPLPHSLGMLYTAVTGFLGYNPYDGEGTVMGLAPYGENRYKDVFNEIATIVGESYHCTPEYLWNRRTDGFLSIPDALEGRFGPARSYRADPRDGVDEHIAASLQAHVSRITEHIVRGLCKKTGLGNLAVAGGVGLNSKLNGEIYELDCVDDLYVFPLANDAGCAVGAAYHIYNRETGKRPAPLNHVYLGPDFTNAEAREAAVSTGYPMDEPADMAATVADLIAAGKVVGWVRGRMEAGPRALGARSILADPSNPASKDIVNERVKHRESWRPFAATILDTQADLYLESHGDARFMIICYRVRPDAMSKLVAASHIDGTNRAQVLKCDTNPDYYDLVKAFGAKTGTYALLNTSFNLKGEPIVRTPIEAADVFANTGMDALVLGRYLIVKS